MKIIEKINLDNFPFHWVDISSYRNSQADRVEIYLRNDATITSDLILLFYNLFGEMKDDIFIYNESWWDFTLETFDIEREEYNYSINDKSSETKGYIEILLDSGIDIGYSGSCKCLNWDKCLSIIIECIVSHQAPYSPLLYSIKDNFFFYFHHTGSIGLYYKELSPFIEKVLSISDKEYIIEK